MLNDKADVAAHRLYQRLRSPVLTDVSIDWNGLPVADVFPKKIPDVFTGKPVVLTGRYTSAATGSIVIHGKRAGDDFTREVPVHFNNSVTDTSILPSFWARRKIDDLMSQDWSGLQTGTVKPEVEREITQLGLTYNLMTQFTSFVAVEDRVVTTNGKPQRVEVPVEMPEGVSYEGIFVSEAEKDALLFSPKAGLTQYAKLGMATRVSGGGGGGVVMGKMAAPPPPPPPNAPSTATAQSLGVGVAAGSGGGIGAGVAYIVEDKSPHVDSIPKPTGERALLESKLNPTVLNSFDCWKKDASNCKLAPDGTIEIQLFLTDHSENVIDQLKALGLQVSVDRPKEKFVTGRLQLDKLPELAKLESVKFIAPLRR